jgi:predicted DNA binding CopG/RHH family protein
MNADKHAHSEIQERERQIALRLPEPDIKQARMIAAWKGIGYQTLLKMIVHEGAAA